MSQHAGDAARCRIRLFALGILLRFIVIEGESRFLHLLGEFLAFTSGVRAGDEPNLRRGCPQRRGLFAGIICSREVIRDQIVREPERSAWIGPSKAQNSSRSTRTMDSRPIPRNHAAGVRHGLYTQP